MIASGPSLSFPKRRAFEERGGAVKIIPLLADRKAG
jgi:hypothetical protein